MPKLSSAAWRDGQGRLHRVEVLGDGQQFAAYGLHPDTGSPYLWVNRDLVQSETHHDDLPAITTEQIMALLSRFDEHAADAGWEKLSGGSTETSEGEVPWPVHGLTLDDAREALLWYDNDDLHYDEWVAVGMALHQQFAGYAEAFELWDEWSARSPKDRGTAVNWKHWQSFHEDRPGAVTMRSVLLHAERAGWTRPQWVEGAPLPVEVEEGASTGEPTAPSPADTSEDSTDDDPPQPPAYPETVKLKGGREFELLGLTYPGAWGDYVPEPQQWVWDGLLPVGEASVVYSDGGVGKTVLAQLLATCMATGEPCLGVGTTQGRSLLVLCEDNRDDVIRRQDRICGVTGLDRGHLGSDVVIVPRKGEDNTLMHFPRQDSYGRLTPFWEQLAVTAQVVKPQLIVIDTAADTFGGNENVRSEVRQFVQRALTQLAERCQCAVLLLAHVSRAGATEGTGGSTAWNNSVRSRLHLAPDEDREGVLELRHRKSNRGQKQGEKLLRMIDGVPTLMAGEEADETEDEVRCREAFLTVLRESNRIGRPATDQPNSPRYAPRQFITDQSVFLAPTDKQWNDQQYARALLQLLQRGVIEAVPETGRTQRHLVIADAPEPPAEAGWLD